VLAPTLGNVGTHGIFANRIESMRAQDLANLEKGVAARDSHFQPVRTLTHFG
jgi:hypothetical protein